MRGTVKEFTTAPKGEKDGVVLTDGTWVHWPPHLEDRFSSIVGRGDKVTVIGFMETGPEGDTKLEVSSLTNLNSNRTVTNPDRPLPASRIGREFGPENGDDARTVKGTVKEFTTAPKGEVDGLILSDGTLVHWPPHLADRFTKIVAKGDRVSATGYTETGPKGDSKLEISTLTNLGTDQIAENPDRPSPAASRKSAGTREERLRALEEQVEQILRDIQRLRKGSRERLPPIAKRLLASRVKHGTLR